MTFLGHAAHRIGRAVLILALAGAPAAPAAAASGVPARPPAGERTAVIAFVPGVTLEGLQRLPGASVAMLGATQGTYLPVQALLDISQGARTSLAAYDPRQPPALRVRADGTVAGWPAAVRRADAAPAQIVPGLLAGSVPGGAGYAGPLGAPRAPGIAGADRHGRIAAMRLVAAPGRAGPAALALLRSRRLVVARLAGPAALGALVRARAPGTLVVAVAVPPAARRAQLLPVAVVGLGAGRTLTSSTTRTDGLITGIDVAPTVLPWLGLSVPRAMSGQRIELAGSLDVGALRALRARLEVVTARRTGSLAWLAGLWALTALAAAAVARGEGLRWAVRTGALALLWVLPVLLAFAALAPSRLVEEVGIAVASLALGALTGRLVRWPLAPAVPALVTIVTYIADLAGHSHLIVRSLLGSNPLYGSRFYGIGNELEASLPVLLLCGLAAAACALRRGRRSRELALTFAAGGLVLGVAVGWGRLGADVGGVITVGAATAVAVVLSLPGALTGRRVAIAVLVPVAAVAALAVLDLATGGNGHFTRSVLHADGDQALRDVVVRRYELAYRNLAHGVMPLLTALSVAAIAWGVWRRDRLLAGVPCPDAWRAALAGGATAGVAGALANDSGPVLLVYATFAVAWTAAYLRSQPRRGNP